MRRGPAKDRIAVVAGLIGVACLSACMPFSDSPYDGSLRDSVAADYRARALQLERDGAYREALWALEVSAATADDPAALTALRTRIDGKRRQAAEDALKRGKQALQKGQRRRAEAALTEILFVDPEHREARALLRDISIEKARRQTPRFVAAAPKVLPSEIEPAAAGPQQAEKSACAEIETRLDQDEFEQSYEMGRSLARKELCSPNAAQIAVYAAMRLAERARVAGDDDRAVRWYRKALEVKPAPTGTSAVAGLRSNWRESAQSAIDRRVAADLAQASALMSRDIDGAIAALEKVVAIAPDNARAQRLLSRTLVMRQNLEKAARKN